MKSTENPSKPISIKELYFSDLGKKLFYQTVQENLFEGQELKNFRNLCQVLDIEQPYPHGNTKIRHSAAWKCFFEYDLVPDTNRIRIGKIYPFDEIKEYVCPTSNGNVVSTDHKPKEYEKYITPLLEDYCADKGYSISLSFSQLYEILGFVNDSYYKLNDQIDKNLNQVEARNIDTLVLHSAINDVGKNEILRRYFNTIEKKRILLSTKTLYTICYKDQQYSVLASDAQVKLIEKTDEEVIEKKEDYIDTAFQTKRSRYHRVVSNSVLMEKYNFIVTGVKTEYTFSKELFHPGHITDELKNNFRQEMNTRFLNRVITKIKSKEKNFHFRIDKLYYKMNHDEFMNSLIEKANEYINI